MAILGPGMMISTNMLAITIIWLSAYRIDAGNLQIGDMMAFIQYAMQIFISLMMITMILVMLPRAIASTERIKAVFAQPFQVTGPEQSGDVSPPSMPVRSGHLSFNDVTFRYPNAKTPSVNRVSFEAYSGETIAIIGCAGSGKSTLLDLLLRYYDVESGEIMIDGVNIRQMPQESLRAQIGYVPQHAVLFAGSMYENIRMGKQDATDEEVHQACKIALASEFIEQMPDGYNTVISQGGKNLSGGQRQRLCIARALVRHPKIYVFDDSFSALDYYTDARLRAKLKEETREAIVVIVTQRVSHIIRMDRIFVMDNGRIIGSGSHHELLETSAIYKEIVYSQLSEKEIG